MKEKENNMKRVIKQIGDDRKPYSEQTQIYVNLLELIKTPNSIKVIKAPTGIGKTYTYIAATMDAFTLNKRVLISIPTYSQITQIPTTLLDYIQSNFYPELKYMIFKGRTNEDYKSINTHCQDPEKVEAKISSFQKRLVKHYLKHKDISEFQDKNEPCDLENCYYHIYTEDVVKMFQVDVVLTVHAKLISSTWLEQIFDVLFIDESHSFKNQANSSGKITVNVQEVLDQTSQIKDKGYIKTRKLVEMKLKKGNDIDDASISRILQKLSDDEINKSLPNSLKKSLEMIEKQKQFGATTYSKGSEIGVRSSKKINIEWKGQASIALISASIVDDNQHIHSCRFGSKSILAPMIFNEAHSLDHRFNRRPIFVLSNGPLLGTTPDNIEVYQGHREIANSIIFEALLAIPDEVTLILCRNNNDATNITEYLKLYGFSNKRLLNLSDVESEEQDTDYLEKYINDQITLGKKIICASASSKLWEGANIIGLKFVIIDALPYPGADVSIKSGNWYTRVFIPMVERIQQGIGRLVREDGDYGIALIIDGRYFGSQKRIENKLPNYLKGDIRQFITRDELTIRLKEFHQKIKEGRTANLNTSLEDYFFKV